jgi:uncharacterized protein YbaR (Trm112 family)
MPILVVCPGCRKSFNVNEKFAGKQGACPKCKHIITVPKANQQVEVHAPQAFASGGRSVSGQLVTKPVSRKVAKFTPTAALAIGGSSLIVLLLAFVGGRTGLFTWVTISPALLLLSPVLCMAAYVILRDDDLEPYAGQSLYIRAAICGAVYAALWGAFEYVGAYGVLSGELWTWLIVLPPFVLLGGLGALATFDLDFGTGVLHFGFYALVTILLRAVANIPWPW